MSITLRLCEVSVVPGDTTSTSAFLGHWNIEINNGFKSARMELRDPSSTLSSQALRGLGPEETIAWDLEVYPHKPFETTKHDTAAGLLTSYGRHLASQIAAGELIPKQGHLWLQIVTPRRTDKSPEALGPSLQHLHWEVLEDVSLWPRGFNLTKVGVVRSLTDGSRRISNPPLASPLINASLARHRADARHQISKRPAFHHLSNVNPARFHSPAQSTLPVDFDFAKLDMPSAADARRPPPTDNTFRILLVVCRPNARDAAGYQLVAKSLVSVVDHISRTKQGNGTILLHILRPPTWKAFKEHLGDATHRYDLVHFDTKGKIQTKDTSPTAVLEFCRPKIKDPAQMKEDWIPAGEVCKVLVQARVRIVVLNACDSASFRASVPGTNIAEMLLGEGIQSVLAMAYKVSEEAVEIFMDAFYTSLLVDLASVEEATYHSRLALLRNQSRRAPLMLRVELADHIIPVLYDSNLSYKKSTATESKIKMGNLAAARRMVASVMAQAVLVVRWATGTNSPPVLLGRDWDLLSLETYLSAFSKVFLHGQGGVGKTEVLRYACRFWKSTGWIKGAAYIDFDQQRPCPHKSMTAIAKSIASQLRFAPGDSSERAVLDKLRAGRYLVVFDSAEVFTTDGSKDHYESILGNCSRDLASDLADFIDKITDHGSMGSMVVVASRLETAAIAHVLPHHKYLLSGLSVLSSVRLIQDLAFKPGKELPRALKCRGNIDMLRRAAILVEGNPVALRLIVPELRHASYDCEALFNNLLNGVCTTLRRQRLSVGSRFERSMDRVCELETYEVLKLAPFWNIMPKDLKIYKSFLFSYPNFDLAVKDWLSEDFVLLINESSLYAQLMSGLWPSVERRLIQTGILSHATIGQPNEDLPCYHIHPVFTLRSRALLNEKAWNRMRFAFVRAARLWYSHSIFQTPTWTHVRWDDSGHQHEDLLHNWRVMALAWCVKDGNFLGENLRTSGPLFDCVYQLGAGLVPVIPRLGRLLIPHLTSYLHHLHARVNLLLPGQAPTDFELSSILTYSWELWRLENDVLKSPPTKRAPIVEKALGVFQRWKAATATLNPPPAPPAELCYQQLLHAAAITAQDSGDVPRAKALYEAHLATSPTTTNAAVLSFVRVWQFYSLQGWSACVVMIAMQDGSLDMGMARDGMRLLLGAFARPGEELKPGQLMSRMGELAREHLGVAASVRVRDQFWFAVQREPDMVRSFGWLARELLDEPILKMLGDVHLPLVTGPDEMGYDVPGPGNDEFASDRTKGGLLLENLARMDASVRVEGKKEHIQNAADPQAQLAASLGADFESLMRMFAGDIAGAEAASQTEMKKEALSSTTSTGSERLAELHLRMYGFAVKEAAEPDYKKGLTHLREWWKLQPEGRMTPKTQCSALIDFMKCYHGLGRVEDTARAAIDLVQVGERVVPADCSQGEFEATHRCLYLTIFGLDKLHVFLDPNVVVSGSPSVAGLTFVERARMHQIMIQAKERWMERERTKQVLRRVKELRELLDIMGE